MPEMTVLSEEFFSLGLSFTILAYPWEFFPFDGGIRLQVEPCIFLFLKTLPLAVYMGFSVCISVCFFLGVSGCDQNLNLYW